MDILPVISVIIPSYNSINTIKQCLDSVLSQTVNLPYEIIVVDSSDDNTPAILKKCEPEIKIYYLPRKTIPAIARNVGISKAAGKYLAFTDADCIVDEDWLKGFLRRHEAGYDVVCGSIMNARRSNLICIAEFFIEFREQSFNSPLRESDFLVSCNFSIKSDLIKRIGNFPEIRASEDMFLSHKIKRNGTKILFDPKIKIQHMNRNRLKPFLSNQLMLGFNAAVIRRIIPQAGSFLVKDPVLATSIPAVKTIRTLQIISRYEFPHNIYQFWHFLMSFPLFSFGLFAYSLGFSRGIRAPESVFSGLTPFSGKGIESE